MVSWMPRTDNNAQTIGEKKLHRNQVYLDELRTEYSGWSNQ